jgi:hypothetical protein
MWFVIGFTMVHQICTVPNTQNPNTDYMMIKCQDVRIPI